jgi:hypothetical protein
VRSRREYRDRLDQLLELTGWTAVVMAAALALAGCGGNGHWSGEGCSSAGNLDTCTSTVAGRVCTATRERDAFGADMTGSDCSSGIDCNQKDNASGNVCRVRLAGGRECVAVLPDGGKAPRYKPKYVTCPDAPVAK